MHQLAFILERMYALYMFVKCCCNFYVHLSITLEQWCSKKHKLDLNTQYMYIRRTSLVTTPPSNEAVLLYDVVFCHSQCLPGTK